MSKRPTTKRDSAILINYYWGRKIKKAKEDFLLPTFSLEPWISSALNECPSSPAFLVSKVNNIILKGKRRSKTLCGHYLWTTNCSGRKNNFSSGSRVARKLPIISQPQKSVWLNRVFYSLIEKKGLLKVSVSSRLHFKKILLVCFFKSGTSDSKRRVPEQIEESCKKLN